jgi:signal transduction histidine kinase
VNYTSTGSITLSATQITPVDIDSVRGESDIHVMRVKFEITDTGTGIAKSEQIKLWQPYVRVGTANFLFLCSAL